MNTDDLSDDDIGIRLYDSYKAFGFEDAFNWKQFNPPPEEKDNAFAHNGYKDGYDEGATKRQIAKHVIDSTNNNDTIKHSNDAAINSSKI